MRGQYLIAGKAKIMWTSSSIVFHVLIRQRSPEGARVGGSYSLSLETFFAWSAACSASPQDFVSSVLDEAEDAFGT